MTAYIYEQKKKFWFKLFYKTYGKFLNFDTFVFLVKEHILLKMAHDKYRVMLYEQIQNLEPWLKKIYAVKEALLFL